MICYSLSGFTKKHPPFGADAWRGTSDLIVFFYDRISFLFKVIFVFHKFDLTTGTDEDVVAAYDFGFGFLQVNIIAFDGVGDQFIGVVEDGLKPFDKGEIQTVFLNADRFPADFPRLTFAI
jgi:hypothetical protein